MPHLRTVAGVTADRETESLIRVMLDRDAYRCGLDVEWSRDARPSGDDIADVLAEVSWCASCGAQTEYAATALGDVLSYDVETGLVHACGAHR